MLSLDTDRRPAVELPRQPHYAVLDGTDNGGEIRLVEDPGQARLRRKTHQTTSPERCRVEVCADLWRVRLSSALDWLAVADGHDENGISPWGHQSATRSLSNPIKPSPVST